jgi:uncharacterized integral membrane protein
MSDQALDCNITFRDFQFLQTYMARRVFAKNRRTYSVALLGVVLCAILLAMAIYACAQPYRFAMFFGRGIPYPISFYLFLILCLIVAILCLMPAVRLRLKTLRMQVSDDGPFLGPTKLIIEDDGLVVDRAVIKAKYLWAAFQGVEIAKNAVILQLDNGIGIIIPAAAFASDAERFDFAAVISKRLEERAKAVR